MVSISKCNESEPDVELNLHISDSEADGKGSLSDAENLDMSLISSDKLDPDEQDEEHDDVAEEDELEETVVDAHDIEELLHAETIVKGNFGHEEIDQDDCSRDIDDLVHESDEEVSNQGSPKHENKDNGDLLLIIDEKATDEDATEYENIVVEQAKQDSEDAKLNCSASSSSPIANEDEESNERTDRLSPDDMMDIGDNILDIGEATNESDPDHNEGAGETVKESADERNAKLADAHEDETTEHVGVEVGSEEKTINDDKDPDVNGGDETEAKKDNRKRSDIAPAKKQKISQFEKRGRGRPKKEVKCPPAPPKSKKESNKENVQDKEAKSKMMPNESIQFGITTRLEGKEGKTKAASSETVQFSMTTRSLKRNSVDVNEASETLKRFKSDSDVNVESSSKLEWNSKSDLTVKSDTQHKSDPKQESDLTLSQLLDASTTDSKSDVKWPRMSIDSRSSFLKVMSDKGLKTLSRESLEAFVVQKICESLVYKSEVARLFKNIKDREGTIDSLQKEIASLHKQSKDMVAVHEKLLQELQRYKNNREDPLLVPRITRSVGLQACAREVGIKRPSPPTRDVPKSTAPPPPPVGANTPTSSATQYLKQMLTVAQVAQKAPVVPRTVVQKTSKASPTKSPANIASKSEKKTAQTSTVATITPTSVRSGGAGVIDLTSDDDKKSGAPMAQLQRLPNGTKLIPPNGHKIVVINGQPVVVKIPTNQPQGNIILNNAGVTMVASSATSVRSVQPSILRTTNCVNANTTPTNVRTTLVTAPAVSSPHRTSKTKAGKGKHPAPLPISPQRSISSSKPIPPRPILSLSKTECGNGIILSWCINFSLDIFAEIVSYQIYAYQETTIDPRSENWIKVGDVKALDLPMAVTLTQFVANNRYYFAVRAVDILTRVGPFSEYQAIELGMPQ